MRVWMEQPTTETLSSFATFLFLFHHTQMRIENSEAADKFKINFLPVETMGHGEATLEFGYPFTSNRDRVVITLFLVGFSLYSF